MTSVMKTWPKIRMVFWISAGALTAAEAVPAVRPEVADAIQAIKQATDPSEVVTAYANGFAIGRNEPKLYDAYVARMVDLGLPELAYHQAQTLTTLQSNNGLAWGVGAYGDARRGQMPEALSDIILAGQFAPGNKFVQRTAGEIIAWHDLKADQSQVAPETREAVARLHSLLDKEVAFSSAYDTAKKAYQSQASASQSPDETGSASSEQVAPSSDAALTGPLTPPVDYFPPEYYSDWGPGWVEPSPSWWWQPAGVFVGCNFLPFGTFVVFDHHHHLHHDGLVFHDRFSHGDGFFVRDSAGKATFFGRPARVNPSLGATARGPLRTGAPDLPVVSVRPNDTKGVRRDTTELVGQVPPLTRAGPDTQTLAPQVGAATSATTPVMPQHNFAGPGTLGVGPGSPAIMSPVPAPAAPQVQPPQPTGGTRSGGGRHRRHLFQRIVGAHTL